MFGLGVGEMAIIGVVAVLLFGNKLPSVCRSIGSSVVEFKKGLKDIESEANNVKSDIKNIESDIKKDI